MAWQDVKVDDDKGFLRISNTSDYVDVNEALRMAIGNRRGWETWKITRTKKDGTTFPEVQKCPKSTYADAVQISVFWSTQVALNKRTREELDARRNRWLAAAHDVGVLSKDAAPSTVYPKNRELWAATLDAAIAIDVEREEGDGPSQIDAAIGYFQTAIPDALGWVRDRAEDAARDVGKLAGSSARGMFDGLGLKEVLIGAGVIAGAVLLIPILSRHDETTPPAGHLP